MKLSIHAVFDLLRSLGVVHLARQVIKSILVALRMRSIAQIGPGAGGHTPADPL